MEKLLHITEANADVLCLRDISLSIPERGSLILKGLFQVSGSQTFLNVYLKSSLVFYLTK